MVPTSPLLQMSIETNKCMVRMKENFNFNQSNHFNCCYIPRLVRTLTDRINPHIIRLESRYEPLPRLSAHACLPLGSRLWCVHFPLVAQMWYLMYLFLIFAPFLTLQNAFFSKLRICPKTSLTGLYIEKVGMIRKYHNHPLQTNPRHHEEEDN